LDPRTMCSSSSGDAYFVRYERCVLINHSLRSTKKFNRCGHEKSIMSVARKLLNLVLNLVPCMYLAVYTVVAKSIP
jgi:hypothetical protein